MKKYLSIFLMLSAFVLSAADAPRKVRVSFYDSPGCHEITADGTRSGYGCDFMKELAAKTGWDVEYVGFDWSWDKVLETLEKGEIDIVDFVTWKPDRAKKMLFSKRPMAYTGCAIRTLKDRADRYSMANIANWGHVRVAVLNGDVTENEFREFAEDYHLDYEICPFENEADGVEAMRRGEIDIAAFEELVSFPELVLIEICKPFTDHLVTRKDDAALMAEIDAGMAAMDRDDPHWMTRIHQKYFPSPTVYAYVPAEGEMSDQFRAYLHVLLARLDEVMARNIEIRYCRSDFSDADFSVPSFACGVAFGSKDSARFRFPPQSAGSRRADLFGKAGSGPLRIGYLEDEGVVFRPLLERYAVDRGLSFTATAVKDGKELRDGLNAGKFDCILRPSGSEAGLPLYDSCGFVEFYLAPGQDHPELTDVLDKALKYLRLDDSAYFYDLERRFFGIDTGSERLVKLGAYVEKGLSVRDPDGNYSGVVTDFADVIAKRCGWHLSIIPLSFTEAQRALADGTIDLMGAAVWTPERAKVYDYSRFDIGSLYYALMKRSDGRMVENRPDTWSGVRIGIQRGSLSVNDLEKFLSERGVKWEAVSFNDLEEGENLVRAGKLDAVYSLAHDGNRDLVPLVMLPTKLCYFCSNKRKPWIKSELDEATDRLLQENHGWIAEIYEKYLTTTHGVLVLSNDEIEYVKQLHGRKIRVSFLDPVDPIVYRDAKSGEFHGLFRRIFDRIAERSGLEFEYCSGDSGADIYVQVDGKGVVPDSCLRLSDWYRLPVCRVRRREPVPSVKGSAAIMKSRSDEDRIARKNGVRYVILDTRDDCYRAVMEGQVEYIVDNLSVALKRIDVEKRYDGLFYQRVDMSELSRSVTLFCPTASDPRLRSILAKARDSLSQKENDLDQYEEVYGGVRPLSMKVKSALMTSFVIVVVVVMLLLFAHHHLRVARAANLAKTSFLFNMSHDIRTPMNAIRGFTQIARGRIAKVKDGGEVSDVSKISEYLDKIDNSGELLLSLINSVLDMSRVESGKAKLELSPCDVMDSFLGIRDTMKALAKAKGISLEFGFGEIRDRYISVDFEKINRVFVNLISNAIKYTPAGGWVRVKCEQIDGSEKVKVKGEKVWYRYTFEDNGIGISEEFQKHVFEEFARERNSTSSGIQGTGLGLPLCKSFVELMGGTIRCESKQGVGTKFTVELPFRIREEVKSKEKEVKSTEAKDLKDENSALFHLSPFTFTSKRVLLVEDNELNREVAEHLLKEQGFEVEVAVNGAEAVEKVRSKSEEGRSYDFVLMDIQMPVMDGYEATRQIRAWEKEQLRVKSEEVRVMDGKNSSTLHSSLLPLHLPIIALSANAFAEDRKASLAAGMDDHVAKPVKVSELMAAIERQMRK